MSADLIIEKVIVGMFEVNSYIVGCKKHLNAVVIDPGDSPEFLLDKIKKGKWNIVSILNTHAHADHVGANRRMKNAVNVPIMLHEEDLALIKDPRMLEMLNYLNLEQSPDPDKTLKDQDEIKLCNCSSIKVIHTPGHSPGGVCFYLSGHLFSGDTLFRFSVGRSDLPGGRHDLLIKSIKEKLLILPADTVVHPGHGDATTIKDEKVLNPFLL